MKTTFHVLGKLELLLLSIIYHNVTPIYKWSKSDIENYHPITITNTISRVFEKNHCKNFE